VPLLSVIVPVYNEVKTLEQVLDRIKSVNMDKEIIIIDDFSTDGSRDILRDIEKNSFNQNISVILHSYKKGKGESVREGILQSMGDFVVIQDADLEYDPNAYMSLFDPLQKKEADLVIGVRFIKEYRGVMAHRIGNKLITAFLNLMFQSALNDYASCYKMASRRMFIQLGLKSKSFDIEAEIICKALKAGLRITEVPISYCPREYSEGKKIRWFDGLHAVASIIKYRLIS